VKRVDVFPAILRLAPSDSLSDITTLNIKGDAPQGSRFLDRCRVVILRDMVLVALDSPEGPKLVFRERVVETHHVDKTSYVRTESGKILAFTKDENCGCGSRLRSWNPYGNVVGSSEDPVE
jgi:hypothetical protein